jgi:hypothetical protein
MELNASYCELAGQQIRLEMAQPEQLESTG